MPSFGQEHAAVFICHADGRVEAWNESAERLLGFSAAVDADQGLEQSLQLEETAAAFLDAMRTDPLRAQRPVAVRPGKGEARSVFLSVTALRTAGSGGGGHAWLCMAWDESKRSALATPVGPVVPDQSVPFPDASLPGGEGRPTTTPLASSPSRRQGPEAGTVLLVEDNAMVRKSIATTLRGMGYEVLAVDSGEQCLEAFRNAKGSVDLLITDVMMPNMNGKELIERVRLLQPGLRVLFMSGYDRSTLASRSHPIPAEHFLQKPFDSTDLALAVRRAISAAP